MKVTVFQSGVYNALSNVPRGFVTTYAALATAVGCGSPRAIGQALRRNPFAPRVPCHRVIHTDGSLGGYSGATQGPRVNAKWKLLEKEGVRINKNGKIDAKHILRNLSVSSPQQHSPRRKYPGNGAQLKSSEYL